MIKCLDLGNLHFRKESCFVKLRLNSHRISVTSRDCCLLFVEEALALTCISKGVSQPRGFTGCELREYQKHLGLSDSGNFFMSELGRGVRCLSSRVPGISQG